MHLKRRFGTGQSVFSPDTTSLRKSKAPGASSLAQAYAEAPCFNCQKEKNLQSSVDCTISGFPLACSTDCSIELSKSKKDLIYILKSMREDLNYTTTPAAKSLFNQVLLRQCNSLSQPLISSWREYIKTYTNDPQIFNDELGLRLMSAAYSYVMTLTYFLPYLRLQQQTYSLSVLGARAEAMMPIQIWQELGFFHPVENFRISLIGDHVPQMKTRRTKTIQTDMEIEYIQGLLHDLQDNLSIPDAYVLYNPGIAHPYLRDRWYPTICKIMATRRPLLITSFSGKDQENDINILNDISNTIDKNSGLEFTVEPQKNPFRSLKYHADPLNLQSFPIQTNSHVLVCRLI